MPIRQSTAASTAVGQSADQSGQCPYTKMPWYAAIIIGGLAIVTAPLVEQGLPVSLRVTTKGVALLSLLEIAAAAASLMWA